ncbi:hypothetical protein DFP72DRAFT_858806 [Ephemerocybe angulata]|uniref:Uncharacterized protein n=1 Tax=Ephemerocybe angulata TaxID=980116 RepID=A0A8H6HCN5_9AGAR|nr:hypothetical protein DFP72DRAFT_858806 [Tulosesus angulatus]
MVCGGWLAVWLVYCCLAGGWYYLLLGPRIVIEGWNEWTAGSEARLAQLGRQAGGTQRGASGGAGSVHRVSNCPSGVGCSLSVRGRGGLEGVGPAPAPWWWWNEKREGGLAGGTEAASEKEWKRKEGGGVESLCWWE